MSLKAKLEAIIYATEEPVTLNELASVLQDAIVTELRAEAEARLASKETISEAKPVDDKEELKAVKASVSSLLEELIADYASADRGMEIREIAGGYRMATKPEHHDVVVRFAKSLKPPVRLSLPALETLSVIAYKQPVTVPEISEIRGVDSAGVIATLLDRKLITTAGRKQVIGRPILYRTTKEFLLRFGLKDVSELPSMQEFEKLSDPQAELFTPSTEASASASEPEPVTEAVPEPGSHLIGETTVTEDGTFATEAEPEKSTETS